MHIPLNIFSIKTFVLIIQDRSYFTALIFILYMCEYVFQ